MGTCIVDIHATFIDKETFKKSLNDDQALAEDEHDGIHPRTAAMEYRQKSVLRKESENKEQEIYD